MKPHEYKVVHHTTNENHIVSCYQTAFLLLYYLWWQGKESAYIDFVL